MRALVTTMPKQQKTRISLTLTTPYLLALEKLVSSGLYMNRGEAILEALRIFLKTKQVGPFYLGKRAQLTEAEVKELIKDLQDHLDARA